MCQESYFRHFKMKRNWGEFFRERETILFWDLSSSFFITPRLEKVLRFIFRRTILTKNESVDGTAFTYS